MSKELEALKRSKTYFENNCVNDWEYNDDFNYKNDLDIIETALKALEIIKEKRVAINILYMSSSAYVYNELYEVVIIPSGKEPKWEYKLTQEEYDLLKTDNHSIRKD